MDVDRLRIGGGVIRSTLWNQIQADVYGRPVEALRVSESAALGAALIAGVGSGIFASVGQAVEAMVHVTDRIEPNPENHHRYEHLYQACRQAYQGMENSGAFASIDCIQTTCLPGEDGLDDPGCGVNHGEHWLQAEIVSAS